MVRYERQLTTASMGSLWVGRLIAGNEAGRAVLLRRIQRQTLTTKELDSLRQGAAAYSKVRHSSLVKLLGIVEQGTDVVTVSEHLVGISLLDLMRQTFDEGNPIPATVAVRIVLDAAKAIAKAHLLAVEAGLFPSPRISLPDGIFIATFGGTLLTEIGTLAILANAKTSRVTPDVIAQLAPEETVESGSSVGSPEVFSLGVLIWECLANRRLFSLDSAGGTSEEVRSLPIPSLDCVERFGMPVPQALVSVVNRAIERSPERRYESLDAFVTALERLPQHFVATEQQVAEFLRQQTPNALLQCASDDATWRSSGAFSEVPPSRVSTRPPAAPTFGEESPTFAQRKLVTTNEPTALGAYDGTTALATTEPPQRGGIRGSTFPTHARSFSGFALSERRPRRKPPLAAAVFGLFFLCSFALGGLYLQHRRTTQLRTDPASISGAAPAGHEQAKPTTERSEPAAGRLQPVSDSEVTDTPPVESAISPDRRGASQDVTTPAKTNQESHNTAPATDSSAAPATKRSSSTFRPREIAPYRPTGI
ncbi:MAG: hypothetical protein QM784_12940 [Polyangiaceae bacterium]